ncbi:NUDIX hydrolase [Anthocerotibacter panamensis]|uniref:NUDIX hydrolase n=1 Tax=Anthocerotibacter panamensis TaxID=2857077 RepID=UPI001C403371|nr:NUDIX hydrolase [Anthocerotibacter panamensis]
MPRSFKPIPSAIISDRLRFQGLKFTFLSQELRFPNGAQGERQFILHPGGAVIVPITATGTFVCIRQYRFAIADYLFEFPAGTLEPGEEPFQTVLRELQEETGFTAHRWDDLGHFHLAPGYSDEMLYIFLARDLEALLDPPPGDDDEDLEVIELSAEELTERMATTADFDAKTIACFFRAQQFLAHEKALDGKAGLTQP